MTAAHPETHPAWPTRPNSALNPIALAVAYALAASNPAWAGPAGEQVVAGQASVSRAGANTLITQTSDRAAINWQSFSIGTGEAVRFAQPSMSSVALNRVVGQNPSEILGSLSANGQVFLVNPNGVLFGKGAQVDVGGLVASTLSISDSDFMAGRYRFTSAGLATGSAEVVNAGHIIANGGYIALIGPQVKNSGNIVAASGSVALAAGEQVTLNLNGNKLIGLTVDKGALNALADNKGLISAGGGQVLLTAKAADQLIKSVVNNEGIVEAGTLKTVNGIIRLEGDTITHSGTLRAEGNAVHGGSITLESANDTTLAAGSIISANGARGGELTAQARGGTLLSSGRIDAVGQESLGGTVKLLGDKVALLSDSRVDVSGKTGGGVVLVGGDYQGRNSLVQNATRAYLGLNTSLKADAISSGDGGKVVVWADDITRVYGNISARGGAAAGNGGFVEVSGKADLDFRAKVDLTAPFGRGGTLLLDPLNILINTTVQPAPPDNATGTPDIAFADAPVGGTTTVQVADVTGFAELYLQATKDITLASAMTMAAGKSVRLEAGNNININAALVVSGAASVTLTGGSVVSTGAGTITSTGAAASGSAGGNITITSTVGAVTLGGAVTANGGTGGAGQMGGNAGNVSVKGATTVATAAVTATGGVGSAGKAGGNGGGIAIESNGTLITTALQANGGKGGTGAAAGGNAGIIAITNLAAAGTLTATTLTASTGAAVGAVISGVAGSVSVKNNANTLLQVGAIDTRGGAGGDGGSVSLISAGNIAETSTIQTGGGALNAGTTAAGRSAGNITLSGGIDNKITGAITASGGAGLGANQAGGKAAVVSITGTGVLTTAAITASTGAATGTGAGGTAGSITLSGSSATTGALTTTGGSNGAGGNISVTSTSGATTINGAVASSGGAAIAAVAAGSNAGKIIINSAGALTGTGLTFTASGSNATGANLAGGNGALIDIDATGTITTGNIAASGGNGIATNAIGGNAGLIAITNNSVTTGAITTGSLTARTGAAVGTGAGGSAGSIALINTAAGLAISTTAIDSSGQTSGAGGDVTINGKGNITVTGTLNTFGAALGAGTTAAGRSAGNITLSGGIDNKITGAITASGGAGLGANQAGGKAAVVSITGTGVLTTAAITASTGAATGTGAGGTAGSITLSGSSATTGALTTTGGSNGAGGNISVTSTSGATTINGAVASSGGAAIAAVAAGSNAGKIIINSAGALTGTGLTFTASGSNATGANLAGGNGALIDIDATGTITTGNIAASGGNGIATNAIGGNAGLIAITNNSVTTGAITTGSLTARTGAAVGTGAGGSAGSIALINTAAGLAISTTAIDSSGQTSGAGGDVTINGKGNITVTGTLNTFGAALGAGTTAAGRSAGNITLSGGIDNKITGAITASGGAGLGANQAGGKAAVVSITGTGVLTTAAITASTGAATGTGAGGTAGSITLSGSSATTGALTTTGGSNGAGGNISVTSTSGATTINGAVASSGGAAIAAVAAGSNAGKIIINSAGALTGTGLTFTASGSNATGANLAGGNGALIDIDATGTITTGNIAASGGNGIATNAIGGNAGLIAITNNSVTTGAITTGSLTARTGAAVGTGAGGSAGSIALINTAAGLAISTTAIDSSGQTSGAGGDVTINGKGNITVTGTLNTFGAALGAGTTAAGRSAGNITLSGGIDNKITGAITASGGAGLGANQAGGKAAVVSITGTGVLTTAAITASTGAATGTGAGGTAGSITLSGSTVTTAALTTTGGSNGAGGNISVTGTSGAVIIGGAAISSGGNSLAAAVAGGTAGAITVDAGGATPTITLAGNLTAAGGNKSGAGTDGAGAQIRLMDAVLLNAATVTVSALGGSAGTGAGGNALFDGAVDSTGGARILVVNTNANTVFGGAAGAISPLQTLTTDTKGTTQINGGAVTTVGTQIYNDTLVFGAATSLNTTNSTITAVGAVTATTGILTLATGTGDITMNNAANNFGTVAVTSGKNVTLRDNNALDLGTSNIAGALGVTTAGAITQSGAVAVSGVTTLVAGAANNITLNNTANNFATVLVTSGNNVTVNDKNALTVGAVNATGNVLFQTAVGAGNDITLAGNILSTAGGITLASGEDINYGANTLTSALRWLTYSVNPVIDTGTIPLTGNAKPNIYDSTFAALGSGVVLPGTGNHHVYSSQPTLTYTASVASRTYGVANPAFSGTVTGLVNSDVAADAFSGTSTFSSTATLTSNVGSYDITGAGLTSDIGYIFAQAPANATAFSINPATLTYTATAANRLYGAADPAFSGSVTGFVLGENQGSATTGALTFTTPALATANVGSYALNGSGLAANNGNYIFAQAPANATAFSINPATLTYTATAANRLYGAADPALSGSITGFVLGENQGSATTGALTFTTPALATANVGSYALNGSGLAANNGNYIFAQAPANATAFSINPATLTYTATAANRLYGAADPALSGSITGFVLGENQGSATTGALTFTTPALATANVGSYALNGSGLAANNGNYIFAQAPANATAFSINPATLTYTATAANRLYGAADPAFSGSVTGFVLGENQGSATTGALTFTTPALATANVGSYALNGSGLAANNGNYIFAQAPANATAFSINPATLTYTATAANRLYGAADPAFSGSITGFVLGENQGSATTGALTFTTPALATANVGSYALNGSGLAANNGNYIFAQAPANATAFSINPATLTYTATAANRLYGAADPAFSGSITGFVLGENQGSATTGALTFTTPALATANVGSYALNGSGLAANNGNYIFAQAPANATAFSINPATLTYTATAANRLYGAADPAFSGSVTGFVLGENQGSATTGALTFTTPALATANVGSYALNGSGLAANNGNYIFAQAPANATAFSINPATLTYTATAANRLYGAADPAFSGSITGFVLGENQGSATTGALTFTTPALATANVGSYALNGSGLAANNGNYIFAQAPANATAFSINPATLTYTATAANRLYGAADPAFSGSITGFVLGENQGSATTGALTFTTPALATANVGSYALNGSGLAANNGNYIFAQAPANATAFSINPATLTYTATAANRLYGAADPAFSGSITGFVLGENQGSATTGALTFTTPALATANVGSYALNGSGLAANNGNYIFAQAPANATAFSINPATLTYTATAANRLYGAADPAFSGSITGFVLGENQGSATTGALTFTTPALATANVGSYALNGSGLAANNGNYIFAQAPANATAFSINPATLTYTATAANRLYGAADPAFSGSITGFVLGENQGSATTGALTFTTPALATANVGSYALNGSGLAANNGNYIFAQAPANATAFSINPATLTYTATAANRLYGAADPAFSGSVTGFVLGENQGSATTGALTFTTPALATANVGSYALNGSGLAANNGNYIFAQAPANATAFSINPATLSLAGSRAYDATVNFVSTAFGIAGTITTGIGGQSLVVTGGPGTVASTNVAAGVQALTLGGLTLSDGTGLASNYTLTGGAHTGTVTTKTINLAGVRVYDATGNFAAGGFTPSITGTVGAETLTVASGTGAVVSANVATGLQSLTTGTLALGDGSGLGGNYTLAGGTHTGTVTAKTLTASITGTPGKIYNGTTAAILGPTNYSLTGLVGIESATVTQTAGDYNSKDVLTATTITATLAGGDFTAGGGTLLGNYSLPVFANGPGAITPAALTGNVTAANRVYDATAATAITSRTLIGVIGADAVFYSGGTATFADKNVGAGKAVTATGLGLTGAEASNYSVNTTAMTTANITPAAIASVSGIAASNKVYDATTAATLNTVTAGFTGLLTGDALTVAAASGAFTDKNVANGKTVNISGITLGGADAGNYTLTTNTATATASITPAAIASINGLTANDKVYDATTAASLSTVGAVFVGALGADSLAVATASGAFADKNAGIGKTVSISGLTLGGADAGNYTLTNSTAIATARIAPATLSVVFTGLNKVYDGTTAAMTNSADNRLAGDALTINRTANFADANTGTNKPIGLTGVALSGADAGNYAVSATGSAAADIAPRGITIAADSASRIYGNADPAFTFAVGGAGLVSGDTITSVITGALARVPGENASGSPYAINQGSLTANANYSVSAFTPGQLTITPRALAIAADHKAGFVGGALPLFTASYTGLALADTPASLAGALMFATPATATSSPGAYAITPSGQSSTNYNISYVTGTLFLSLGTNAVSNDLLASITSGATQLGPQFLSGPFVSGPQALPTNFFASIQPNNVTADGTARSFAQASDILVAPGAGDNQPDGSQPKATSRRPLLSGAVKLLVNIIDGGVRLPSPADNVAQASPGD